MKVKGIYRDKARAGDPMEFSAEEKVPLVVQEAISNYNDFEGKYASFTRNHKIKDLHYSPKGELLKGKWQHNVYRASGTVTLHRRNLHTNTMLAGKQISYNIVFEDCVDENGQPDLSITKFTVTGI